MRGESQRKLQLPLGVARGPRQPVVVDGVSDGLHALCAWLIDRDTRRLRLRLCGIPGEEEAGQAAAGRDVPVCLGLELALVAAALAALPQDMLAYRERPRRWRNQSHDPLRVHLYGGSLLT